ncbi:GtrA family protein [Dictyobacter kobayashii]|uniref:GtrA/DPMS transmembrane domain-containing protein n=1 Tax=Dictyobacter kobayashii TaxID=2014872 RepID=A0A402AR24_9CHLR|nr:GtrA family protein [Dictyobacter kobayashii]GCE21542.1 hypothetical protein KDK_53420 [Dictyobacter kobayashii]
MTTLIKRLFKLRIIRYGLVGGIGIPINVLALYIFKLLLNNFQLTVHPSFIGYHWTVDLNYALASACSFEVSTTINFLLNQIFTYSEQQLHGWHWVRRAARAQVTSLSALLLTFAIGLVLVYGLHVNEFIANPIGIIVVFIYNFFISKHFVFKPTTPITTTEPLSEEDAIQQNKHICGPAAAPFPFSLKKATINTICTFGACPRFPRSRSNK